MQRDDQTTEPQGEDSSTAESLLAGFAEARQPKKQLTGMYGVVSPFSDDEPAA